MTNCTVCISIITYFVLNVKKCPSINILFTKKHIQIVIKQKKQFTKKEKCVIINEILLFGNGKKNAS